MAVKRRYSSKDLLLHDHCTNEILNEIRLGRLQPGQRLGEVALAKKLKVGRAAVRVAFDRLAWAGLLQRIPRSGTYVRKLSLGEYTDLMQVRARLEGLAASLACLRLTDAELDRLDKVAGRLDELDTEVDERRTEDPVSLDRDYAELQNLESEFHSGLARSSGNPCIEQVLQHFHMLERAWLIGMSFPAVPHTDAAQVPAHKEIVKAMRTRSPEAAEKAVYRHFQMTEEYLLTTRLGSSEKSGDDKESR